MKAGNSNQQVQALIIGNSTDEFTRYAIKLACGCEIDYILCSDIYSAVGMLAKNDDALVIGRFENLNKEGGWIFRGAAERKFSCCCLVRPGFAENRQKVAALGQTGVFVINEMEELESVVMKVLAHDLIGRGAFKKADADVFNKERFAATRAEMDALLGG